MTQKDLRVVKLLRLQTDELLRDVATGDYQRVRQYFPSDVDVNVPEQLQRCFGVPPRRLNILTWDAEKILVEPDPDGRHARTGARLRVQEPSGQIGYRGVVFHWVSADATCQVFYLVPQNP
jgi:hypothetical protein